MACGNKVYLVDDDASVRTSLTRVLSRKGYDVESFPSAETFLENHDPDVAGCAVIDLRLPGMNGLQIQDRLLAEHIARPIIFLTGSGSVPESVKAMKAGAVDFLTKPISPELLVAAVEQAQSKDQHLRREMGLRASFEKKLASLTPREHQVMLHVVAGKLNKQIAAEIGAAEKTVKIHRGRMMKKMGIRTVAELTKIATNHL